MNEMEVQKYRSDAIYIIESESFDVNNPTNYTGTCFSISSDYLLTAFHVIKYSTNIKIYLSVNEYHNGNFLKAKKIWEDKNIDLALLKIENHSFENYIDLYKASVSLETEVFICGYPAEKEMYPTPIKVQITNTFSNIEKRDRSFEVSQSKNVSQYKGMSGSPVLYESRCIGILLNQQSTNTLYAISADDALQNKSLSEIINHSDTQIFEHEGKNYQSPEHPTSPFKYPIHCKEDMPHIKGLDIGFEFNQWDISNFTESVYEWIKDYSLSYRERANFKGKERKLFKYARGKFSSDNLNIIGDLCLHIAIRESYKTIPILNKVFDEDNTIFSCTHAILNMDKIELWIGASSVQQTIESAVEQVICNIEYISNINSLKKRLYTLTAEIDESWPYHDKLVRLSDSSLPLDERFDEIIIPVFIMHDSNLISNYDKENFINKFKSKIINCRNLLKSKSLHSKIAKITNLKVFYFPVSNVNIISEKLNKELNS